VKRKKEMKRNLFYELTGKKVISRWKRMRDRERGMKME
jgi:hypothetical protein